MQGLALQKHFPQFFFFSNFQRAISLTDNEVDLLAYPGPHHPSTVKFDLI